MPHCPHCGQPMPLPLIELENAIERARTRYQNWSFAELSRERARSMEAITRFEAEIANPPKSWSKKTRDALPGYLEYARDRLAVVEEMLAGWDARLAAGLAS